MGRKAARNSNIKNPATGETFWLVAGDDEDSVPSWAHGMFQNKVFGEPNPEPSPRPSRSDAYKDRPKAEFFGADKPAEVAGVPVEVPEPETVDAVSEDPAPAKKAPAKKRSTRSRAKKA